MITNSSKWYQNGDHPKDEYKQNGHEGKVVRRFRDPDFSGTDTCKTCKHIVHDHGWIDQGMEGLTVCPGDTVHTHDNSRYTVTRVD